MPRRKKEAPVIDEDPQPRGAEDAEIQPPSAEDTFLGAMGQPFPVFPDIDMSYALSGSNIEPSISVPSDSPVVEPQDEKEALLTLLTSKQVSVTELTESGRGLRLYLGKPSMSTFENMLRRSKGVGVVIEPDPRTGVSVEWRK